MYQVPVMSPCGAWLVRLPWGQAGGGAPSAHSTLYFVQGSWPVLGTCWTGRTGPSLYLPHSEARQHRELRTVGDGSYTERQVPRAHSSCVCISVPSRAIAGPGEINLAHGRKRRGGGRTSVKEGREYFSSSAVRRFAKLS